jgi:subtilisin family serine protease
MPGRRRISDLTAGGRPGPQSIFGPGDDNTVPGEVLVALEPDAAAEVTASIPNMPDRGGAAGSVTAFGASELDRGLGLDVISITRLHGATPTRVQNGIAMADDYGLDTTYRIRYGGGEAPQEVAERLVAMGEVVWAEPNRWREASATTPNDPDFGSQWGLTQIGCPDAWDLTTGDPSIVVAVIDTGVDLNHPDLAGLLVGGQDLVDFSAGAVPRPGWVFEGDFTGVDATAQDEVGHGTHVAGTICSLSNNARGVAGVCWNVRLMPVKVLARIRQLSTGRVSGSGSAAHIAAGIRWATDHGARVINMSLGGYTDTTVEREAVAYAVAHGVVVVAAMANDNVADPAYPAAYPSVIGVGATDSGDRRAGFSNFGPHIDIAAPGVGIRSTYWDDTYATLDGTSMASPHVAGVAALMLSRNSALTATQVGDILRSTAKPLRDAPADPVPNDRYGHGLVQAAEAVRRARPPSPSVSVLCGSLQIACRPSVVIVCPTTNVTCVQSVQVICRPSVFTICRTVQVTCFVTRQVRCQVSQQVLCQPSNSPACNPVSLADCPSLPCPNSLACRSIGCNPGGPGRGPGAAQSWEEYDPYGYDPYGGDY